MDAEQRVRSDAEIKHDLALECKTSGNEKFNKNDYKGAVDDYKQGLHYELRNSDLHANLSAAYIHLDKFVEAEEHASFAIHLRPSYYKGYIRAAKAAHGKGMTRLSLIRLEEGLTKVSDPDGVKELTLLKNQYTGYLSLAANAEREMEFDLNAESDEENYGGSCIAEWSDIDDGDGDDDLPPPSQSLRVGSGFRTERLPISPSFERKLKDMLIEETTEHLREQGEIHGLSDFQDLSEFQLPSTLPTTKASTSKLVSLAKNTPAPPVKTVEEKKPLEEKKEEKPEKKWPAKKTEKDREPVEEIPKIQQDRQEFQELLKCGTEAYHNNHFRKAAECYKAARERVGTKLTDYEIDERQLHVIKYAFCAALIRSSCYDDIVRAIQELTNMESIKSSIPAIYIQIARAYCNLNRFKNALEPLEKIQEIIDNCPIFPTFTWPGTDKTIEETTPLGLKNAIKVIRQHSRMSHKALAVCRYENCLKISTHILPSVNIYLSDPDFIGYVRMTCEEKCHIEYHLACWKAFKEQVTGVEKVTDKDFLGGKCFTTDCLNGDGDPSLIVLVEIIDSDGLVKSVNKLDSKAIVDSKKSRKKKGKQDDKEEKEKEKEKAEKRTKKNKDNQEKVKKLPKPIKLCEEKEIIEEDYEEPEPKFSDSVYEFENRLESLNQLRNLKYGSEKSWYSPTSNFYGREDEKIKAATGSSWLSNPFDTAAVKDAKEFIFSYFYSTLKEEGPQTLNEVEDLWKASSDNFCDIKSVIPNIKSTVLLLLDCPRFCQVENYLCLLDQIGETYTNVNKEVSDVVTFLLAEPKTSSARTSGQQALSVGLTKGLSRSNKYKANSVIWVSSSDDESDEESDEDLESGTESNMSCDEDNPDRVCNDVEDTIEDIEKILEQDIPEINPSIPEINPSIPEINPSSISVGDLLSDMSSILHEFKLPPTEHVPSTVSKYRRTDECSSNGADGSSNGADDCTSIHKPIVEMEADRRESDELASSEGDVNETNAVEVQNVEESNTGGEDHLEATVQEPDLGWALDKRLQNKMSWAYRIIQTSIKKIEHRQTPTIEADLETAIIKKLKLLQANLEIIERARLEAADELALRDNTIEFYMALHEETKADYEKITRKYDNLSRVHQTKMAEFSTKEAKMTKMLDEIKYEVEQKRMIAASIKNEKNQLKEKNALLVKEVQDLREKWTNSMNTIKENENLLNSTASATKKFQQNQLITIKAFWDTQIAQLKKRCVEKISEIQNFFKLLPAEDIEGLPSLAALYHNTQQWKEVMAKLQQIEAVFQSKYASTEGIIARGEKIEDLTLAMLPVLPDEPAPLPLDTIMREVMEKYSKRNAEAKDKTQKLTLLVANQQLELENSKETIQQYQQLINTYQMAPRMQTPMSTTSFGGLAMQFSFPPNMAQPFNPTHPPTAIPTIPPPVAEASNTGTKKTLADVQAILQESCNAAASLGGITKTMKEEPEFLSDISFLGPPLDMMKPPPMMIPPPMFTAPPPTHGAAHKVIQAAAKQQVQDMKQPERSVTPKSEASIPSREQTPIPSALATPVSTGSPTPNTEKPKKKKKSKNEAKEVPLNLAVNVVQSSLQVNGFASDIDDNWSVVGPVKSKTSDPARQTRKTRLLEQLLLKHRTITMKDMEEILKRLRELNNNKLSGLPYHEIESRVSLYLAQRATSKIWGMAKFTDAPWGNTGKLDSNKPRPNLHLDECIVCLEPMIEKTKTKLDCNHEFHTQCLRKWLKEKRVCPLCNKFAAMPDEFPAL